MSAPVQHHHQTRTFPALTGSRPPIGLAALLIGDALVQKCLDSLATGGFVQTLGVQNLPLVWSADMTLTLVLGVGWLRLLDRVPRAVLVMRTYTVLALSYLFVAALLHFQLANKFSYTLVNLLSAQQSALLPALLWSLAADRVPVQMAARWFPRLAATETIAQMLGYAVSAAVARWLGATAEADSEVLMAAALLAGLCAHAASRWPRSPALSAVAPDERAEAPTLGVLRRQHKELTALTLVVALCWMAINVAYFHIARELDAASERDPVWFRTMYAGYNIGSTLIILAAQAVAGRFLAYKPLLAALVVLPAVLVLGGLGAMAVPGLGSALALAIPMYVVLQAWDEPARNAWLTHQPEHHRGRLATLLHTQAYAAGCLVSSLALLLLTRTTTNPSQYLWLVVGPGTLAWWLARRLGRPSYAPVQTGH